ncbi:MAG: ribonuclease D [Phenylobacterium sp.]
MQHKYLDRPTKEQIRELPDFKGLTLDKIHVVSTADDLNFARQEIFNASHIGFDTESKPNFIANQPQTGPHLVQISTENHAFLFHLSDETGQALLAEVIESQSFIKVGFGLKSDRGPLQRKLGIKLQSTVELSTIVKQLGYKQAVGLKAAVAIVLGEHIKKSKSDSTSNWGATTLSNAQLLYAANDAYAALRIYSALNVDNPLTAKDIPRV